MNFNRKEAQFGQLFSGFCCFFFPSKKLEIQLLCENSRLSLFFILEIHPLFLMTTKYFMDQAKGFSVHARCGLWAASLKWANFSPITLKTQKGNGISEEKAQTH